jgi:hypothetical protein
MLDDTHFNGRGGGGGGDDHKIPDAAMLNAMIDATYKVFMTRGMCTSCSIEMLLCVMFARHNAMRQYVMRERFGYSDEQVDDDIDRQMSDMLNSYEEGYKKYVQSRRNGGKNNGAGNRRPI